MPAAKRCQALLRDAWGRPTDDRCGCFAAFVIGARRMCGRHASLHSLQLAIDTGKAKPLPFARPAPAQVRFLEDRS